MKCVLCGATDFSTINGRAKCAGCGLVQASPMPSAIEIHRLYYEDFEHFEPYIAQLSVHRAYFRKKIQEVKKRLSHFTLLDIGCAMGVFLEEAKKEKFRVTGIDISAGAVSYCRNKRLTVYQGTVFSVGNKISGKFDVVTAFEVIEHERDPLAMMRRIRTFLVSGGLVVLTTPNHASFWRKLMGSWWVGYHHPEHVVFFDPQSLLVLCKKAGFRDIDIRHDTPRPFPLSFAFTRLADYIPWFGFFLRPMGRFLDRFSLKNPINPWDDLIVFARKG